MKKAKRFLALFLVLCMMVCAMALPASAYSYNFSFPAQQANSMRSTSLYTRGKEIALKLLRLAQSFKAFPLNTVSSFLGVPVRNSPRMGRNLVEGCD